MQKFTNDLLRGFVRPRKRAQPSSVNLQDFHDSAVLLVARRSVGFLGRLHLSGQDPTKLSGQMANVTYRRVEAKRR